MRVVTLFGTRPEIIRLSEIIRHLDSFCDQILVHTGQNYDENLSDVFFRELGLRSPEIHLGIRATEFAEQAALIIRGVGDVLERVRPDRLLVLLLTIIPGQSTGQAGPWEVRNRAGR